MEFLIPVMPVPLLIGIAFAAAVAAPVSQSRRSCAACKLSEQRSAAVGNRVDFALICYGLKLNFMNLMRWYQGAVALVVVAARIECNSVP